MHDSTNTPMAELIPLSTILTPRLAGQNVSARFDRACTATYFQLPLIERASQELHTISSHFEVNKFCLASEHNSEHQNGVKHSRTQKA